MTSTNASTETVPTFHGVANFALGLTRSTKADPYSKPWASKLNAALKAGALADLCERHDMVKSTHLLSDALRAEHSAHYSRARALLA